MRPMESTASTEKIISITVDDLRAICHHLEPARAGKLLPLLAHTLQEFEITTVNRIAAFIGQLAHESGEFRFSEELWGPTPQQRRYDPPSDLAQRLGNVRKGDGKRYRGRGYIQLTGRENYRVYGGELGVDLEKAPQRASEPGLAFRIAGLYWRKRGLNAYADEWNLRAITRAINGGLTHFAQRALYADRARQVLGAKP